MLEGRESRVGNREWVKSEFLRCAFLLNQFSTSHTHTHTHSCS